MATGKEENGEFCLTVGPVTKIVGILTLLAKGLDLNLDLVGYRHWLLTEPAIRPTCMLAKLGFTLAGSKVYRELAPSQRTYCRSMRNLLLDCQTAWFLQHVSIVWLCRAL